MIVVRVLAAVVEFAQQDNAKVRSVQAVEILVDLDPNCNAVMGAAAKRVKVTNASMAILANAGPWNAAKMNLGQPEEMVNVKG